MSGAVPVRGRDYVYLRHAREFLPEHCGFVLRAVVAQDGDSGRGAFFTRGRTAARGAVLGNKLREPCDKRGLARAARKEAPDDNQARMPEGAALP